MHEIFLQIRREISGSWRYRWWALATAWLVCLAGWTYVYTIRDAYEARAKFYVETTSRLDRVMDGVRIGDDTQRQVDLVRQVMLGRPMLEQVASETELDLRAQDAVGRQMIVNSLQTRISLVGNNNPRNPSRGIYEIAFSDVDRDMAISVVDTLLNSFMEDIIRGKQTGSEETIEFLNSEIDKYSEQLRQREQALADFKRQHVGLLPGDAAGGGYFDRLQRELDEVEALQSQLRIAQSRRAALMQRIQGVDPTLPEGETSANPIVDEPRTDVERRIVELEAQLDTLLLRFTDRHPDVISIREQLSQLHERRREELAAIDPTSGGLVVNADNPVYQQMQISLNDTEIEIAGLRSQIGERQAEIADLRSKVDEIPQIEAQLADLTRDYDQVRSTYDELRGLLEQENLALRQKEWDVVNFRLIDPPFADFSPTSPARVLLLLIVLGAGIAAGVAVAWVIHLTRPVIFDTRKLQEVIGLPVLGAVSMTWLNRDIARRRTELASFLLIGASLLVAFGGAVVARDVAGEFVRYVVG